MSIRKIKRRRKWQSFLPSGGSAYGMPKNSTHPFPIVPCIAPRFVVTWLWSAETELMTSKAQTRNNIKIWASAMFFRAHVWCISAPQWLMWLGGKFWRASLLLNHSWPTDKSQLKWKWKSNTFLDGLCGAKGIFMWSSNLCAVAF